jgi:hypothetical protein
MTTQFQFRRGTASEWTSANPVLASGELGFETDTQKGKIGNGSTAWNSLVYLLGAEVGDISAVTAGTGLTGGGTAGAVTLNVDTSTIATKDHVSATYVPTSSLGVTTATLNVSGKLDSSQIPTTLATTTYADGILTSAGTYTDSSITTHSSDTTSVHGITDTTTLLTDSNTKTVTNKSISLGSNTVTSTLAQLNTAVSDAELASLAGTETLTNKTVALGSNTVSGTIAEFNTALTDQDFATLAGTETLTNKTLTGPIVSGLILSDGSIVLEGTTADAHETTLTVTDPTADRTITFPDATGTVALTNNKLDAFAATTSAELAGIISDETGTGALVFANTPTLVTPNIGAATGTSLVLSGDLTINGTTTTINSTTLAVDDKNVVLGDVETPTDTTADGGGITLKGATDKTFNWVDATDAWTSSEHINLASGKSLYLNGTLLKDATETFTNKTLTLPKINENVEVTATATELNYVDGVTSAIQTQLNTKTAELYTFTTDSGTSRTLALVDNFASLRFTGSSAITVTVPANSAVAFPIGSYVELYQFGTAQITVTQSAGVTVNATDAQKKSRVQYSSMTLIKIATDEWLLVGDTAA